MPFQLIGMSFADLPLEKRYNLLLAHNKQLLIENEQHEAEIKRLSEQLNGKQKERAKAEIEPRYKTKMGKPRKNAKPNMFKDFSGLAALLVSPDTDV